MKILKYICAGVLSVALWACEDKTPYGEDYDIELPVSSISSISPAEAFVDDVVTLNGENLDMVTALTIGGSIACDIVSQQPSTLEFKVSRSAVKGQIYISNKYSRDFVSEETLIIKYFPVEITTWPSELTSGGSFELVGENIDLIESVSVNGQVIARQGAAEPTSASYSLKDVNLTGDVAIIEVVDLTGQTLTSSEIPVI